MFVSCGPDSSAIKKGITANWYRCGAANKHCCMNIVNQVYFSGAQVLLSKCQRTLLWILHIPVMPDWPLSKEEKNSNQSRYEIIPLRRVEGRVGGIVGSGLCHLELKAPIRVTLDEQIRETPNLRSKKVYVYGQFCSR